MISRFCGTAAHGSGSEAQRPTPKIDPAQPDAIWRWLFRANAPPPAHRPRHAPLYNAGTATETQVICGHTAERVLGGRRVCACTRGPEDRHAQCCIM